MTYPMTGLVTVRGANLITGNVVWGQPVTPTDVAWYEKAWRYLGPSPMRLGLREQFLLATRSHWMHLVRSAVQMAVAFPVMIAINILLSLMEDTFGITVWWLILAGWLVLVGHELLMLHRILSWRVQLLIVTSHRIIRNRGLFGRVVEDILLRNVTSITVTQKPHQRVLGYGTVRIESGGFHEIGSPREFSHMLCDPEDVRTAANMFMTPINGQ